jgi:hypothetical protein
MMAINIYDENGHILKVNLSASECSDYQNADSLKRQEKLDPSFLKNCLAALGPNQPGVTTPDPTDTGTDDAGPQDSLPTVPGLPGLPPLARGAKSQNAPGQPNVKQALSNLLKGGGGTNKPNANAPSVQRPSAPNTSQGSSSQSSNPSALLDYLLSP